MDFLPKETSILEIIEKISTIIIAGFTLYFSCYLFKYQNKKDKKDLKLEWYKLIVIETKFHLVFSFFENVSNILSNLKPNSLDNSITKSEINENILKELSNLDHNLISLLLSVDSMLYNCIKTQFDNLVDDLTNILSDDTIDLTNELVYSDNVSSTISKYKTQILKIFVEFKGENDSHKSFVKDLFSRKK